MMPMGVLDVMAADDSSDLGSLEFYGANGLCDGDLAKADRQPGHSSNIQVDRRMMMNINEADHAHSMRGTCWGSSPDVGFTSEPRIGCEPSGAMPSA